MRLPGVTTSAFHVPVRRCAQIDLPRAYYLWDYPNAERRSLNAEGPAVAVLLIVTIGSSSLKINLDDQTATFARTICAWCLSVRYRK